MTESLVCPQKSTCNSSISAGAGRAAAIHAKISGIAMRVLQCAAQRAARATSQLRKRVTIGARIVSAMPRVAPDRAVRRRFAGGG
jgi:hypothetical protein